MSVDLAAEVRRLVQSDPRLAIVVGEILGAPVGAPDAPARPWER